MDHTQIQRKRPTLPINDKTNGIHRRYDEVIEGQKIEIGTGKAADSLAGSTFRDCEIRIKCAGRMTSYALRGCKFEDCLIWPSRLQSIPTWESDFERCYFKGKYEVRFSGRFDSCDCSAATLHYASFMKDEVTDCIWPAWPHIMIESPQQNRKAWKALAKPKEFNRFLCPHDAYHCIIDLSWAVNTPDDFWETLKDEVYIKRKN